MPLRQTIQKMGQQMLGGGTAQPCCFLQCAPLSLQRHLHSFGINVFQTQATNAAFFIAAIFGETSQQPRDLSGKCLIVSGILEVLCQRVANAAPRSRLWQDQARKALAR